MLNVLENEEFWPLLLKFNQARYFDFSSVLNTVISTFKYDCTKILKILSHPNFPLKGTISSNVLVESVICCSKLSDETLLRAQNPLEAIKFNRNFWSYDQFISFIKAGYHQGTPNNINWNHVCLSTEGFNLNPDAELHFLNNIIGYECTRKLASSHVQLILSKMCDEIETSEHFPRKIRKLPSIVSRTLSSPDQDEISFSLNQVIKIVSIMSITISHKDNHEIMEQTRLFLFRYLIKLKDYNRFPMGKKLVLIANAFLINDKSFLDSLEISNVMIKVLEFLKRNAIVPPRAPWLINVLVLWHNLIGDRRNGKDIFLTQFLEIYFNPESRATSHDIHSIIKFIGRNVQILNQHYPQVSSIMKNHFPSRPDLAKQYYFDYFKHMPDHLRSDDHIFPLEMRLSYIFKQIRRIDNFHMMRLHIFNPFKYEDCKDWIKILNRLSLFLDSNISNIPINSSVFYNDSTLKKFSDIFEKFFNSFLESEWWQVNNCLEGSRPPIVRPSLLLPPQILEVFGFILGNSLRVGYKIPFSIDFWYFNLFEEGIKYSNHPFLLDQFYPERFQYRSLKQIPRIMNLIHGSVHSVLSSCCPAGYWLKQQEGEPSVIYNTDPMFIEILMKGSQYFRKGLGQVLPLSALSSKSLYNLLF